MVDIGAALRMKLCWQIITEDTFWSKFMKAKYFSNENIWDDSNWDHNFRSLGNLKKSMLIIKDFAILLIGNGRTGDLWDDNWSGLGSIRGLTNVSDVQRTPIVILQDISYAYSIDLQESMNIITSDLNIQVHLPKGFRYSDRADCWAWAADIHGRFSTRSAWSVIRNRASADSFFKALWKLNAPRECILFTWKLKRKAVATDLRIKDIGIPIASRCIMCHQDEESLQHLTIDCMFAQSLWYKVSSAFCFPVIVNESASTRLMRIFRIYDHDDLYGYILKLAVILSPWLIWKERCRRTHEDGNSNANALFLHLIWLIRNLTMVYNKDIPKNPIFSSMIREFNFQGKYSSFSPPKYIKWHPPDEDLKLNTDGASRGNPGMSGGGFVVRNGLGLVIAYGSSYYGFANNMEAELRALHDGLRMVHHFGLQNRHFIIESDSKALVNAISSNSWHWNTWYYWNQIKDMLQDMNSRLVHVYREANQAADFLANFGINRQSSSWSNNPLLAPKELIGLVRVDSLGLGTFRF